jgi:hypothetical protein
MIKESRKTSGDPVQEKLRQSKAVWNKDVSTFITDVIQCKKLMNGMPNKFNRVKSRIGDPIPANPTAILNNLASEFQDLAQRGDALVQQQLAYAKGRKKHQVVPAQSGNVSPQQPTVQAPANTPPANDNDLSKKLSLPVAAMVDEYLLLSEASNPVSRFWTRFWTPTRFGLTNAARIRQYRMMLLKSTVVLYKTLGKLQVEIVKGSPATLKSSNSIMQKAWNEWTGVVQGYNTLINNMPEGTTFNSGGSIEVREYNAPESAPEIAKAPENSGVKKHESLALADAAKKDLLEFRNKFINDQPLFTSIINLTGKPVSNKGKIPHSQKIVAEYDGIIRALNNKYKTNGANLADISSAVEAQKVPPASPVLPTEKAASAEQLEKMAQDFLKKWLGYARHSVWADDTSPIRKDAYKDSKAIRVNLDRIMNSVQKGMNIEELSNLIVEVKQQMLKLKGTIRGLDKSDIKKVL